MNDIDFPYTMEAWVWLDVLPSEPRGIWDSGVDPGGDYYGAWMVISAAGKVTIAYGDGTGADGSDRRSIFANPSIPLGRWVHICGVQDDSLNGRIYLNGIEVQTTAGGSGALSITHFPGANQTIGYHASITGGAWLNGAIDEVRIWDIARSTAQIRETMCQRLSGAEPGLAAYWRMDEGSGTTVADLSGNGHNGSFTGAMFFIQSGAPIGDTSAYAYPASWGGTTVSMPGPAATEQFSVDNIDSDPGEGLHVYRVDSWPNTLAGLPAGTPMHYYGVFSTEFISSYSIQAELDPAPCTGCTIDWVQRNANDAGAWTGLAPGNVSPNGCQRRLDDESNSGEGWRAEYAWMDMLIEPCDDTLSPPVEPDPCLLLLPNAFSPNGDGINDLFGLPRSLCLLYGDLEFAIYNRWGKRIWRTTDPGLKWDGTFQGKPQELGVYVWTLRYQGDNGDKDLQQGTVTLIR